MLSIAFGELGLSPDVFWNMEVREFTAAWHGFINRRNSELEVIRHWIYDSARWQAANLAYSNEQARAIEKTKFPHEGGASGGQDRKPLSYDKMKPLFNSISKTKPKDGL